MLISCILFGAKNLNKEEVKGKRIIEVGSRNINGSLRPLIESWQPKEYIGVDAEKGLGVDIICDAENILNKFGKESFDIVISTEMAEHVKNWKKVFSNIKNVCKPNGIILITTRSRGFMYHGWPYDFWRYEMDDMKEIFSDCEILALEKDLEMPGVFVKIKKPFDFTEKDLSACQLYNIAVNKRVKEMTDKDLKSFYFLSLLFKEKFKNFIKKTGKTIFGIK